MALGLRDRVRMGAGKMDEWLRDREADLKHGLADAEARGREAYAHVTRNGQDIVARTTSEVRDLVKRPPATTAQKAPATARGPGWSQQILANARRLETEAAPRAKAALRDAGDRAERKVVGDTARIAGNATGVVTGGVHLVHNALDGAILAERLQNPFVDYLISPPGESATDQLMGIELGALGLAKKVVTDPRGVAHEVAEGIRQLERDTDPRATPEAPTLSGEMRRNFHIGRRQGEVGMEIAPYAVGAGELKATADLGALARANSVGRYLKQGFSAAKAERLAQPYRGMGDHAFIKRGARLPRLLGGAPVPEWIVDSPFNVLKPSGISTGDMYELHFKVDPQMYGARLPGGSGRGSGWSGKRLGLQKYDGPARLWFRTPNATKRAVAGTGITGTIPFQEDEGE